MDQELLATPRKISTAESIGIACLLLITGFAMLVVVAVASILQEIYDESTDPYRPPEISIAVDGCSGLDAARVPRAFNFTVTVDNAGDSRYDVCVGGAAVVLYAGVPLATGHVEDHCVPPRGAGEVAVRAASGGVGLPRELARLMADEERRAGGVARLEVRVVTLGRHGSLMCNASLLGRGAARSPPSPCGMRILMDESDGIIRPFNP